MQVTMDTNIFDEKLRSMLEQTGEEAEKAFKEGRTEKACFHRGEQSGMRLTLEILINSVCK